MPILFYCAAHCALYLSTGTKNSEVNSIIRSWCRDQMQRKPFRVTRASNSQHFPWFKEQKIIGPNQKVTSNKVTYSPEAGE
jgi:hypothetical protein